MNQHQEADYADRHRIRLRGGWEFSPHESNAESSRLTLPTLWKPGQVGRLLLCRRFGSPALSRGQTLTLEIERAPGICSLILNDVPIISEPASDSCFSIDLAALPDRNILWIVVDLDVARPALSAGADEWGMFSLAIRESGSSTGR